MTLPTWNTQLWSQGKVYLPHKNQDQQHHFRICLGLTVIEKHHQVCELCTSGLKSPIFPDLHTSSRELECTFSWFLKGMLTWGTGQDVLPLVSSRNFHAGWGTLNTILRSSSRWLSFHPLQGKQGIGYHSFVNTENQLPLSCTVSVWLGPSCDLLPVTAVPDSTALHVLCKSYKASVIHEGWTENIQ